jgi:hypothetical protein
MKKKVAIVTLCNCTAIYVGRKMITTLALRRKPIFHRKLAKIAQNSDDKINPR